MSEEPNQPGQPDDAPGQQIIRVTAVREDGAPPLPPPDPTAGAAEQPVEPIEFSNPLPPRESPPAGEVEALQPATALSRELQAAKWYTISFLVVTGLFSLAGLAGMIWITVRLIAWIER